MKALLRSLAITVGSLLIASGCGGDPSTVMTQAEADAIYSALQTLTSTHLSGNCPGGGAVALRESEHLSFGSVSLIETYDMSSCVVGSVLLDGSFEYQDIVDTSGLVTAYRGTITTGAGICHLNLDFRTGISGIESPSGSYCGFPARPAMTP